VKRKGIKALVTSKITEVLSECFILRLGNNNLDVCGVTMNEEILSH
jgi:hypothetical protein